jgi:hypothetical protein
MQNITTTAELKMAIEQLEYKQAVEWPLVKEQLLVSYENLKLSTIIKNTFKSVVSEPDLKATVVKAVVGFATGFVAKKMLIGNTNNPFKKLLGFIFDHIK